MSDQTLEIASARSWALVHAGPEASSNRVWYLALLVPEGEAAQPRHLGIVTEPTPEQWRDVLLFARRIDAERFAQAFLSGDIAWRPLQVEVPR